MADPPPPAVGEGLLPPPFLPVAPPPIPVVDAPPLVLEDEKLCKERRIEGMLSQEHKVGGEIHDPRSNMGTCKEFPRSKKRKPQIQEQPTETRMQSQSTNNNTETSKQIKSGVSKKFKSSKNKGAAAALPPVDTMLHKEKMRPEINGDIDVRKEIIGSRRKGRLAISTSPRVTSSPGVNILINATAHRRESINKAAHRRESINEAAHIRPKMTGSPEGSNSQESLNSPSQQPPISPSLHDLSPDGRMTSPYGWTRGRRKLLSRIWKEVEPIYQGNKLVKGRCGHCQKIFPASRDSGSSQIGRHLKVCPAKLAKNEMVDKMGRPEGIDPDWKFDPVIARRKLLKFIVVNEMPFLLVESSSFREFTKSLNPWFENVSRTTLKNDCEAAFQMHGDRMKKYFENLDSRVSLTGDMWTSNQKLGYLCMTCHFISDDCKLHKSIIRFSMMETPHNSLNMFDVVLRSIQEWNIEDKLFSFTLDNASVNIAMLNHLRENLENKGFLVSNGVLLHYRCGTHVFNIIAQYGLKEVKPTVNNIRESCKFVKSSQTRVEKFLDIVMQVGLTSRYKSPLVDVTTRWNSTYLMLEAALPLRGAFSSLEKHDKDYAFAPLATEWKLAEAVCKLLRVFYTATNTLSGSNYPTSHLYFYQLWNIKKTLNKEEASLKMKIRNKEASSQDHIIDRMVQQMQIKFNEYWLESYKSACIPVIFDPRFKYDLLDYLLRDFGNEEEVGTWMGEVKKTMQKLFDEYNLEVSAHSQREMDSPNTEEVEVEDDPLVEWDQHMRSKRRQASNELDCYLKEELLPRKKEVDILQWWKVSSSKYPVLSKMARDILAIPASTVPSESAFSTGGRVVSDYRSSLSSSTVEILICLQDWFKAAELERA